MERTGLRRVRIKVVFYRPQTKLREGYVFTSVCDSVKGGGAVYPIMPCTTTILAAALLVGLSWDRSHGTHTPPSLGRPPPWQNPPGQTPPQSDTTPRVRYPTPPPPPGQTPPSPGCRWAFGTHPTGMHSCSSE